MQYREFTPEAFLSRHVECIWELQLSPHTVNHTFENLSPDCTFDLILCPSPIWIQFTHKRKWEKLPATATLIGQRTSGMRFHVLRGTRLLGMRFKPFAFANRLAMPMHKLTDRLIPLSAVFPDLQKDVTIAILREEDPDLRIRRMEELLALLFREHWEIDETFRAQLNFILNRKGLVQIRDLTAEFETSKVTLSQHFLRKMGLTPKTVSRIWRLNYFLQVQNEKKLATLTAMGLEVGYYDQAHCIKEFQSFFQHSPHQFFQRNSQLLKISQEIISRRFSNFYDPRI
ncbi:MAG: helix-turn-helix domain-containing protein [Saprospiraceae bacterium]|nr:AraC family transcriptional regulator [Lewinella sp.]